ncbi:hypothetical protein FQA39_LY10363 [Lamprigera yunnana]|nr:hypothetical protein FQA39_LY10363 [Lamprigera yunnana]
MSDQEYEKFEITDYDIENEFNPNRTRRGLSKHQQIYGIWADDSDDETEQRTAFKQKASKNFSAPIGFVSGGVQQAGKKDKNIKKEEDEEDSETPMVAFKVENSSSDSESENRTTRTGFGNQKVNNQSTVTEVMGDIAGLRKSNSRTNQTLIKKGVGNWEKHTKGIGAKLLLQMGYQPGKGLGKDLQGISAPVEAYLRKGRGAIGAYGPEKAASVPSVKEKVEIVEDEEKETELKWKKGEAGKRKTRYYYRTVDDVIEKGKRPGAYLNSGSTSELTKVKVIDMTGPQQRVLSGYHALSGLKAPPGVEHFEDVVHKKCSNFALPEIQHNLDLLVNMCEQDIINVDRRSRYGQDKLENLQHEEKSLSKILEEEDTQVDKLRGIIQSVDRLMDPSLGFSLGQFAQMFRELQQKHSEEYYTYHLGELAPGLVGPLITSALASWSPLSSPTQYTDIFIQWKDILEKPQQRGTLEGNSMEIQPYDSLLWHTWVPVLRTCVSLWNVRDCDPLITLLESWKPILPQWIVDNILDQLILPRLTAEVTNWNPLTDTVPIHYWIHPWIPLLNTRLHDTVFPIIQEKLGAALTNWHPSDQSAKLMLKPWRDALPEGSFATFLLAHIVPKLQLCMQSLAINPHQQHLEAWNWVMDWKDVLSVLNLSLILEKYFFPRWLQTLAMWLNHNPDYNQVTEWYSGWKRMLSEELLAQPSIKDNFHKALEMMNRAVTSGHQPGAQEFVSYLTNIETNAPPPPLPPRVEVLADAVRTSAQIPQGFKDLLAKRCEERGILFVPVLNKFYEAKQVYRIGSNGIQVYFDRNVVFYSQNNSSWLPVSLNRLLDMV